MPSGRVPSSGGKLARALLWTSGLAAGLLFMTGIRDRSQRRSLERAWRAQSRQEERERSLQEAIVGSTRHSIAAVFGRPRTWLSSRPGVGASSDPAGYWSATTWYYAMESTTRSAMAIRFDADRAAAVDFIHVPSEARGVLRSP